MQMELIGIPAAGKVCIATTPPPGTSSDNEEKFKALLEDVLLGNEQAIRFILDVFAAAHVWDDVEDGDELTQGHFQRTFRDLFLNVPTNPFYMQHFAALHPIILNSMINWETSNFLEKAREGNDLAIAFILRSSFLDLISVTAFLLGGYEHAVKVNVKLRRQEHEETFIEYIATLKRA